MEKNAEEKFRRELRSFTALNIISIAFGGIAVALAISFIVPNVFALVTFKPEFYMRAISTLIGVVVAAMALRWLISCAEIFSKLDDIKDESEKLEASHDSEKLTGIIVRLMALYREEKPTIMRMTLFSRLAGACFIVNAAIIAIAFVVGLFTGGADLLSTVAGVSVSLVVGAVGLYLPSSFQRYAAAWEVRLQGSDSAEKELSTLMGVG